MADTTGEKFEFYDQEQHGGIQLEHAALAEALKTELAVTGPMLAKNFKDAGIRPREITLETFQQVVSRKVGIFTVYENLEQVRLATVKVKRKPGWVLYEIETDEFPAEKLVVTAAGRIMRLVGAEPVIGNGYVESMEPDEICAMFDDAKELFLGMSTHEEMLEVRDCIMQNIRPNIELILQYGK